MRNRRAYQIRPRRWFGRRLGRTVLLCLCLTPASCKKKNLYDVPEEHGRLPHLARKLEEGFANTNLPPLRESARFAERLAQYEDFRDCLIRTYVARRTTQEGSPSTNPLDRHRAAGIGDESVEECAVQAAIVKEDPTFCQRLEIDYRGPEGERALPGLRCWDARARVLGLPAECPLIWRDEDGFGRNPECLAMARREPSPCFFAESPARCRALVARDPGPCALADAAPDCKAALVFWQDLLPAAGGERLFDEARLGGQDAAPAFTLRLRPEQATGLNVQITAPRTVLGISWPVPGSTPAPIPPRPNPLWQAPAAPEAVHVAFIGDSAVKLAFHSAGLARGSLPLGPPGPNGPASVQIIVRSPDGQLRRCASGAETRGAVRFSAEPPLPGGFVTGDLDAEAIGCDDGSTVHLEGRFRLAILDTR